MRIHHVSPNYRIEKSCQLLDIGFEMVD